MGNQYAILTTEALLEAAAREAIYGSSDGIAALLLLAESLNLEWDKDALRCRVAELEAEKRAKDARRRAETTRTVWRAEWVRWVPSARQRRPTWYKRMVREMAHLAKYHRARAIEALGEEGAIEALLEEGALDDLPMLREAVGLARTYAETLKTPAARHSWLGWAAECEALACWLEGAEEPVQWLAELLEDIDLSGLDMAA